MNAQIIGYRLEMEKRHHADDVSRLMGQIEAHKKTEVVLKEQVTKHRLAQ